MVERKLLFPLSLVILLTLLALFLPGRENMKRYSGQYSLKIDLKKVKKVRINGKTLPEEYIE